MSISIGICERDAKDALCRKLKSDVVRILLKDVEGFEDVVEYDLRISVDDACSIIEDKEAFVKRNRISEDTEMIYLDKIKDANDLEILKEHAEKICTGWVDVSLLTEERFAKAMEASEESNRMTGWDMISFEEMAEACGKCTLSWDKGRGCIGSFGPDNSLLPVLAEKIGCTITASVPAGAAEHRTYDKKDAMALLKETEKLTEALPVEGKMYVRRYTGAVERLKAVAEISVREGCGFYFF